mmetsp:Transcript_33678/g.81520  ORF Transcript_33678/g.81520 Transcript_33678/m.81520 type:complete len:264 (+) Transcript_33678:16-807(+)
MGERAALSRLRKEYVMFQKAPPPYISVSFSERNMLQWNYLLEGPPDSPYHGGWYWGRLKFPKEYPFKPPAIFMTTPNGRFEPNERLCLSMSDFHPETWQPGWSLSTVLMGLLSFMLDETQTTGAVHPPTSHTKRKELAEASMDWNKAQPDFRVAFPDFQEILDAARSRTSKPVVPKVAVAVPRAPVPDVETAEEQAAAEAAPPEPVGQFVRGGQVVLMNLPSRPDLEGETAEILGFVEETQKYEVKLFDSKVFIVRGASLVQV